MIKKIKLNESNIKTFISDKTDYSLSEEKIDNIIKTYLTEMSESKENDEKGLSTSTIEIFEDFSNQIEDFNEELEFINEKDGDILLENEEYLDSRLMDIKEHLFKIQDIMDSLKETNK